jgi:hypothetical protein
VAELEHATRDCTGFILNVCLSYGGRSDITSACRQIASKVKEGTITPSDVNEEVFASHLSTGGLPDPDLLIRTSGETRLSNFLPWQVITATFFIKILSLLLSYDYLLYYSLPIRNCYLLISCGQKSRKKIYFLYYIITVADPVDTDYNSNIIHPYIYLFIYIKMVLMV